MKVDGTEFSKEDIDRAKRIGSHKISFYNSVTLKYDSVFFRLMYDSISNYTCFTRENDFIQKNNFVKRFSRPGKFIQWYKEEYRDDYKLEELFYYKSDYLKFMTDYESVLAEEEGNNDGE